MLEEIGLLSGWLAEPPRCRLLPAGFLGPSLCCAFSMRRGRPVVTVVTLARGGRSGRARARGEIPARGCSCVFARGNSSPLFHLPIPPPPSPCPPFNQTLSLDFVQILWDQFLASLMSITRSSVSWPGKGNTCVRLRFLIQR